VNDVRVLTVDDQEVFLKAARALIRSTPGFTLAGEAHSGEDAIRAVDELHPDLVLMDVRMPGLDGLETTRRLIDEQPGTLVILVTGHDPADFRELAHASGALDLVPKESLRPRLLTRLWEVHGGKARTVPEEA
jgi:DNA-binding NarL/FixJ family response regulator